MVTTCILVLYDQTASTWSMLQSARKRTAKIIEDLEASLKLRLGSSMYVMFSIRWRLVERFFEHGIYTSTNTEAKYREREREREREFLRWDTVGQSVMDEHKCCNVSRVDNEPQNDQAERFLGEVEEEEV